MCGGIRSSQGVDDVLRHHAFAFHRCKRLLAIIIRADDHPLAKVGIGRGQRHTTRRNASDAGLLALIDFEIARTTHDKSPAAPDKNA